MEVSEGMRESLAADGASSIILEFVGDGLLDFAEYEQGMLAYVECREGYGWNSSAGFPRLAPWGVYQVRFEPYTAETREARGASMSDVPAWLSQCERLFWRGLSRIWDAAHSPSEVEEQAARDAVASCLNDAGAQIPEHPDARFLYDRFFAEMEAGSNIDPWVKCIRSVEEQHYTSGTGIAFAPSP